VPIWIGQMLMWKLYSARFFSAYEHDECYLLEFVKKGG